MNESKNQKEISGFIIKEEELQTVNKYIVPGTMVLETKAPFYGYYSNTPAKTIPQTYFLFTKKDYSLVEIYRATEKIKKYLDIDFDAVKAEVVYHNAPYPCIRIYFLENYELLPSIQKAFIDEGIKMKSKSTAVDDICQITTYKVFLVEEMDDGLFVNRGKSSMTYFTVDRPLTWAAFEAATKLVKSNWDGHLFDAALGVFQRRGGIQEVIRIYGHDIDLDTTKDIKEVYEKVLKTY